MSIRLRMREWVSTKHCRSGGRAAVIACVPLLFLLAALATACGGSAVESAAPSASPSPPQIDSDPPATSDDAPSGWQDGAVTVTLTAEDDSSDVAKTKYRVDGGRWRTGSRVRITADGIHRLQYYSVDASSHAERKQTCTVKIDKKNPVTKALSSPTVAKGKKAVLRFRVSDRTPRAQVSIRVKGKVNKTFDLGWRRTGKSLSFARKFPVGSYSYVVYAEDQAGNRAKTKGSASFQVKDTRYLARIRASVSDSRPGQYSDVTAYCHAYDQFGRPIAGAAVSFTWQYKTVSHTERGTTGSDGVTSSTRWISGATIGYYVQISVSASWRGRYVQSSTGFTPR